MRLTGYLHLNWRSYIGRSVFVYTKDSIVIHSFEHLWRQREFRSLIRVQECAAAVGSVKLYVPEAWQIWHEFRYLNAVIFVVLVEYSRRIFWLTQGLVMQYCSVAFCLWNSHSIWIVLGDSDLFWVCQQNDWLVAICYPRKVVVGGWFEVACWRHAKMYGNFNQLTGPCRWS